MHASHMTHMALWRGNQGKKRTHTHTHTHTHNNTFLQIPTHLVMPMWVFELFRWPGQISFQNSGQKKNFVDWRTRLTGQCCSRHMTAASWKQKKKLPLDLWSIIYYQGCHQLNSKKDLMIHHTDPAKPFVLNFI